MEHGTKIKLYIGGGIIIIIVILIFIYLTNFYFAHKNSSCPATVVCPKCPEQIVCPPQRSSPCAAPIVCPTRTTTGVMTSTGNTSQAVTNLKNIRDTILSLNNNEVDGLCSVLQEVLPVIRETILSQPPSSYDGLCVNPNIWIDMLWSSMRMYHSKLSCVRDEANPQSPPVCTVVDDVTSPMYIIKSKFATDINSLINQIMQKVCTNGVFSATMAVKIIDNISKLVCTDKILTDVEKDIIDTILGSFWKLVDV